MPVIPYDPSLHTWTNKPYGIDGLAPTDARSYYYDDTLFIYRPYDGSNNNKEVTDYLNVLSQREGNFSIFIKDQTTNEVTEWWFKDGTADNQLVPKTGGGAGNNKPGSVLAATDAEMQAVTAVTAEDAPYIKVPSRVRIYWWWDWIKKQVHNITGLWSFNIVKWNTVTMPTGTIPRGHFWFTDPTLYFQKSSSEEVITSKTNAALQHSTERVMTANTSGGLQANYELVEEITTDNIIITACNGATFNPTTHEASIFPVGVVFYKGQKCKGVVGATGYLYLAIQDNTIIRITLA